mmetsp:Transcript_13322/g.27710  ORF Transcript_13322/g.27710 Transcript_13322/m.27710 type:complete len:243 (+) Transcript_13322:251-979(+)
MRALEVVSEVKSSRISRISSDGRIRCAQGRDATNTVRSRQVSSRTSAKGLPGRFVKARGSTRVSATVHTAASGVSPAAPSCGARPCKTAAQHAIAPLLISFCDTATRETSPCMTSGHWRKNARPLECAQAFAQALSAQRRSALSRLSSMPASVCARGASLLGSSTSRVSGLRSSTKPSSRATQSRTEPSHMGSRSSRASWAGRPCWLKKTWPAGNDPKASMSSTAFIFSKMSSVKKLPSTCL